MTSVSRFDPCTLKHGALKVSNAVLYYETWFFQGDSQCILRPEICPPYFLLPYSRSAGILPVLRISGDYLFARSTMYFRLRERELVPERNGTSKPAWLVVTTSNVTWVHIERTFSRLGIRWNWAGFLGNFFLDPGIIRIIANHILLTLAIILKYLNAS